MHAIPSRSIAGKERRVRRGVHGARNMHEDTLGDRLADATGPDKKVIGVADGGQVSVWVGGVFFLVELVTQWSSDPTEINSTAVRHVVKC